MTATEAPERVAATVPLRWDEVYFTNCPMVSANNVDQELGWCREEFKKIGVEYAYFRSRKETNSYPHYIHNLDNLIRFGGLYPPINVHADIRRTRCSARRRSTRRLHARPGPRRHRHDGRPEGPKIGLTKSLNTIKNDWWRYPRSTPGIESHAAGQRHDPRDRRADRRVPLPR